MSGMSDAQKGRQWFQETIKIHRGPSPDLQKVIAGYKKSLKYNPHDPEVLYTLGVAYLGRGEVSNAVEQIDRSLSIKDDVPEAWFHFGQCHMLQKNHERAEEAYRHALRLTPRERSASLHFAIAMSQQARNQVEEAKKSYREGLSISPEDFGGNFQFAVLLLNTRETEEATRIFDSLLEKHPDQRDVLNYRALLHAQEKEFAKGRELLGRALEKNGKDASLLFNLGQMFEQDGKDAEAEEHYKESLELKRDQPGALGRLGMLCARGKRYDEALALFDEALEIAPKDAGLHYLKGVAYAEQDDKDTARKLFEKAIELQPAFRDAQNALAQLDQAAVPAGESVEELEKQLEDDPESTALRLKLAQAYMRAQRPQDALPVMEELLKEGVDDAGLFLNHGFALSMTAGRDVQQMQRSRASLQKGLSGRPEAAAMLRLAQVDLQLREADEAADLLKTLCKNNPADARICGMYATALQQKGRFEEAIAQFHKALELDPEAREPVAVLAQLLELTGKQEEAVEFYRRWTAFAGRDPQPGLRWALLHNRMGDFDKGLGVIDEMLETMSFGDSEEDKRNAAQVHFYRGLTLLDLQRQDEAELALQKALELKPDFPEAQQRLQHLAQIKPLVGASIDELEASVQKDPDDLDDRYLLSLAYLNDKNWDKAIEHLTVITEKDDKNHRALFELSNAHVAAGDTDRGIDCLILLEERVPGDASIRYRLADLMLANGEVDLALKEFRNAVDMMPNNAVFNFRYGIALKEADREDKAEQYIRKALEIQENFAQAWYELGLLEYTSDRADGALGSFQKSLSQNPQQPMALYYSALIHRNVKEDAAMAVKLLQSVLSLKPDFGDAHYQLARIFGDRRPEDAVYHLEAALGIWDEENFHRQEAEQMLQELKKEA